ncbi:MAG: LytR/AlgR family response regulator transcription factor [Saprospiraceae bacterium]
MNRLYFPEQVALMEEKAELRRATHDLRALTVGPHVSDEQRDYLTSLKDSAEMLRALINEVLDRSPNLSPAAKRPAHEEAIYVRENNRLVRVPCDEILYFENVGDYIRIKTTSGQHIIHGTLKSLEERLDDPRFQKVHRTYIVNLAKIKDIEEGSLIIEKTVIPVSRAHRAELMSRLRVI